jgi:hypothetical protein
MGRGCALAPVLRRGGAFDLTVDDDKFNMILRRVIAHEIGHCPKSGGDTFDHGEGGLMDPFGLQAGGDDPTFTARSIKRMRDADSWKK